MYSMWASRMGLSVVRCAPQAGTSVLLCSRQTRTDSEASYYGTLHQGPSYGMSAAAPKKQKLQRSNPDKCTELNLAESCKHFRRFITDPGLICSIVESFAPCGSSRTAPVIMECNPGPGLLTQALVDAGHKVFALESNSYFLPSLERIESSANGQLKVVHCDFFRIDPWTEGLVQPPSMYSSTLMKILNFTEVPWASDVPLKVFLMLGHKKERILLWRQIYSLYQRLSVYRYGRIELNIFMTEKQYLKLVSRPGDFMKYQALSVLFQAGCDIELLHKEPVSTFLTPSKFRSPQMTKSGDVTCENLCLVKVTPRRNLFSENFTPTDGGIFIFMIKQFLTRRKSKLIEKLDNLSPGNGKDLLQNLALPVDVATGCIYPEEYKLLFKIMSRSEEFNRSFVLDEICEDIEATSY